MTEEITVYDPRLPSTPGWIGMSEAEQKWLREHDGKRDRYIGMAAGGALKAAVEEYIILEGLKGKTFTPTRYLALKYKKSGNGWKIKAKIEDAINKGLSLDTLGKISDAMIEQGIPAGYDLGEIMNALFSLRVPRDSNPKAISGFVAKDLRPALYSGRSDKRKGKKKIVLSDDKATAPPLMFNACRLILKNYKELTSAERKHIIKTSMGWLMDEFAIPGKFEIRRLSTPEEVKPRPVGRPREMGK